MPHEYSLLKDAALRRKEMGDKILVIKGADFGGDDFYELEWENVHFYDCIFYGMIRLSLLKNALFERCQFPGSNFQAYAFDNVRFLKSDTIGKTYLMGGDDSKKVWFEECHFGGNNADNNQWGAVGAYGGDTVYDKCTGQYSGIFGRGKSVIWRDCKFKNVELGCGRFIYAPPPTRSTYTQTLLENLQCSGETNLINSNCTNLTIRMSRFGLLDLSRADITGEVLIDRVTAELMLGGFDSAPSKITVTNSVFTGREHNGDKRSFDCYVSDKNTDRLQTVLIDNIDCARDTRQTTSYGQGCVISGGKQSTIVRNSKIPNLIVMMESSASVLFDQVHAEEVSFAKTSAGDLTFRNTTISKKLDFTGVQVKTVNTQGLSRPREIITEGSNVKL